MRRVRMTFGSLLCAMILYCAGCTTTRTGSNTTIQIDTANLMHDISVLASDSFLGRKPFTTGETKTVDFLTASFSKIGAVPGNGSSFFQDVPMVEITPIAAKTMEVSGKGNFSLNSYTDYVVWTNKTQEHIELNNTPVVFAGYGVVAPEYNWNDYANLDVKGKLVLVMVNDPGFWNNDTTLFKGRAMTYYGRWTYKFEEAKRQGARGCLVIHRTSAAGYPYAVVQNGFNAAKLHLDNRNSASEECDALGWIKDSVVEKLFTAAGYDASLFEKANKPGFQAVDLGLNFSTSMKVTWRYDMSKNVIAKIPGTKRPDEVIIYTAHWDHLGVGEPDETGDSIYNGALDNATGTAALLELARNFKKMKPAPERSIVFLALTGEEQGLLGSEYYARHPVYPLRKTVADINMDVLNTFGVTNDLVVVGYGQSELDDYLKAASAKFGGYIVPEPRPETGGYFRSDHFNFAKVGVPALYAGSGDDVAGKGKDYGIQLKAKFTGKNYHRPSDEVDPANWKIEGAAHDLRILFEVGKQLSFETRWPRWKPTSEFKAIRDAQQ